MKGKQTFRILGVMLAVLFSLNFLLGCSTDPCDTGDCGECESGDCNITIINLPPEQQGQDGLSGVNLTLTADYANGLDGNISINLLEGNTETVITLETIVIDATTTYRWEMEPGYYSLQVWGIGFQAEAKFLIQPDHITVVGLTLQENPIVTWDLLTDLGSPSGMLQKWQSNQVLFSVNVSHNWDTALSIDRMTFFIDADEKEIEIDRCQLDAFPGGVRTTLGGAPNSCEYQNCFEFSFESTLDSLDPTFVAAGEVNTYQLACDIGQIADGARLRVHLLDFAMAENPPLQSNIPIWPHGNWLWYPTNTIFPAINSQTPIGLKVSSLNQSLLYLDLINDSLNAQTVTELSFELHHAGGFNVNSCRLVSEDHFTTYHTSIPPDTSGAWPTFTFTNLFINIAALQDAGVHLECDTTGSQINSVVQAYLTDVQATIPTQDYLPLEGGVITY